MGQLIADTLAADTVASSQIREIRGRGLMLGIELVRDCGEMVERGLEAGQLELLTAQAGTRVPDPVGVLDDHVLARLHNHRGQPLGALPAHRGLDR